MSPIRRARRLSFTVVESAPGVPPPRRVLPFSRDGVSTPSYGGLRNLWLPGNPRKVRGRQSAGKLQTAQRLSSDRGDHREQTRGRSEQEGEGAEEVGRLHRSRRSCSMLTGLLLLAGCTVNVGSTHRSRPMGPGLVSTSRRRPRAAGRAVGSRWGPEVSARCLTSSEDSAYSTGIPGSVDELFDTMLATSPASGR